MKTFRLGAKVTVSAYTEVEAETAKEAREIAEQRTVVLNREAEPSDCWVIEEADGEPCDIEVLK